jgi:FtsP/CotA-like multicopper oxidase with cupredoxin domain
MDKCCRKITKVFNSMTVIWVVALLCLALTGGAFLSIVQPGYSVGRTISSNGDGSASNSNNVNDTNAANNINNNNDDNVNIPNPHPEPIPSTPAPAIPNPAPTFPSPFPPSGGGGVDHWTYGGIPVLKTAATTTSTVTRINTNTGIIPSLSTAAYDKIKGCAVDQQTSTNTETYLTHFACGHISPIPASVPHNSTNVLRKFTLFVHENVSVPITPPTFAPNETVYFNGWTFNGSIPGPTLRVTQGDHVMITVVNDATSQHAHSFHMHSMHSGDMDGVSGMAGSIPPGKSWTYSFIAAPFGIYPYHCHVSPVTSHINHGLYGMMIIDPVTPRPAAKEIVMMMNGYNLVDDFKDSPIFHVPTLIDLKKNFTDATKSDDGVDNQIYTVNGRAFYFRDHPIHLVTGQKYRIYLANMLEFDTINSFHLHGNMYYYYPSGTSLKPAMYNDVVELGQGDRGIMEFTYHIPGQYMFHAHINRFTDLGWMGMFDITRPREMGTMSSMGITDVELGGKQSLSPSSAAASTTVTAPPLNPITTTTTGTQQQPQPQVPWFHVN